MDSLFREDDIPAGRAHVPFPIDPKTQENEFNPQGGHGDGEGSKNHGSQSASAPEEMVNTVQQIRSERKQNSACDACRLRKVKCYKLPGDTKCAHCKAKKLECTRYYVTLASTQSKRSTKRSRQPATGSEPPAKSVRRDLSGPAEFEAGTVVQVRRSDKSDVWSDTPHEIVKVIYKPVAVVLDDELNSAISVDLIRPIQIRSEPQTSRSEPNGHNLFTGDTPVALHGEENVTTFSEAFPNLDQHAFDRPFTNANGPAMEPHFAWAPSHSAESSADGQTRY